MSVGTKYHGSPSTGFFEFTRCCVIPPDKSHFLHDCGTLGKVAKVSGNSASLSWPYSTILELLFSNSNFQEYGLRCKAKALHLCAHTVHSDCQATT